MTVNRQFYRAKDVKDILHVSMDKAYRIIRDLNSELKAKGYYTISGRVSAKYFEERVGIE